MRHQAIPTERPFGPNPQAVIKHTGVSPQAALRRNYRELRILRAPETLTPQTQTQPTTIPRLPPQRR